MKRKSSERKSRTSLIAQGFGPDLCIPGWLTNCGASNVTRKEVNEVNDTGAFAIKNWTTPKTFGCQILSIPICLRAIGTRVFNLNESEKVLKL